MTTMPYRNEEYLKWIRSQPCCLTKQEPFGWVPIEACHYRIGQDGGTSLKPSDYRVLPMTSEQHRRQHAEGEETFWNRWHTDPRRLIIRHMVRYIEEKFGLTIEMDHLSDPQKGIEALEQYIEAQRR